MNINIPTTNKPRVVIIGGGFGGLAIARKLKRSRFQVVMIDRNNYHTFQPLLYQVATAGLEPDSIAYPLRRVLQRYTDCIFRLADVERIDAESNTIFTSIGELSYDYLVLATGSNTNFFGLQPVSHRMMPMKSVPEALNLRSMLFQNFERALLTSGLEERKAAMNVVIVGAGPTGVELAGALAEMRKHVLPKDYPELDLRQMEVHLFERGNRVLPAMSEKASAKAASDLEKLGVTLWLGTAVDRYEKDVAYLSNNTTIGTRTLIWAAGVKGQYPSGLPADALQGGRILVDETNRIPQFQNVFAIGDVAKMASAELPHGHPMVAPVAIQQGELLARNLKSRRSEDWKPFVYRDKGSMATIGRNKAVVDIGKLRFQGMPAWFVWMFVHVMSLIGFRNRVVTLVDWVWNYFTYDRSLRLIIRPFKRPTQPQE